MTERRRRTRTEKRSTSLPQAPRSRASWGGGKAPSRTRATADWIVLRKKEKPSAELFSVSYVADGARPRPARDLRLQRRPGRLVRVPARGRGRARSGSTSRRTARCPDAPRAGAERSVVAGLHRSRLRRPGRHRVQPHRSRREKKADGKDGDEAGDAPTRRSTSATSATSSRCASSWDAGCPPRPLGLAGLHRRRELRRLSRRPTGRMLQETSAASA